MRGKRVAIVLAAAGVVILVAFAALSRRSAGEGARVRNEALRREMLDREVVVRGLAGRPGAEEARAVLRWWFDAVAATDRAGARTENAKGENAKAEVAWRRYAEERLAALRAGYDPTLSASEQGLRLDILSIRPGEHPDTHERALRVDFALWGAPRRLERDGGRGPVRVVVPLGFRQLSFRFLDASRKTYGEMTGTGDPWLVIKDPERFSAQLPPGVALGTWWVDPFPREAAEVEVAVQVQVQGTAPGAALTPTFRWEVPVAEEWRLRPGEVYRAETREVAPEPPAARVAR